MIGRIRGALVEKSAAGTVIVEAAGVGYELSVPERTLAELGEIGHETTLLVHTHVREDDITLYGFARAGDRAAFRLLLTVTGVGPRIALAVLSSLDARSLAEAVARQDVDRLRSVSGVGRKIAERVVLELRDKISASAATDGASGVPAVRGIPALVSALVNLGYRPAEAERAAAAVGSDGEGAPIPELVREALRILER